VTLDEMTTGLGRGTKNSYLHKDEIKKHNHQILKFKTQSFHLLPLFSPSSSPCSFFFIPSRPAKTVKEKLSTLN